MNKFNTLLLVLVIVLLLILVGVIFWQKVWSQTSFYAVYLETGDLYFGKLARFSRYTLSDVHFLQRNPNDTNQPYSIQRLDQAFWKPENAIKLNPAKVVWITKLVSGSDVVNFLEGLKTATSTSSAGQ
ncbi:MAG: hypothetical protein WC475_00285 [Candidatus Paceibacterota bacterium]